MDEYWKPCPGFESTYEASTNGRVRRRDGKMMKFGKTPGGVKSYILTRDGKQYFRHAARLVMEAFTTERKRFVVYHDADRMNATLNNLRWSNAANIHKKHYALKLTHKKANHILTSGMSYKELMFLYGVSKSTIQKIKQGLIWRK